MPDILPILNPSFSNPLQESLPLKPKHPTIFQSLEQKIYIVRSEFHDKYLSFSTEELALEYMKSQFKGEDMDWELIETTLDSEVI